VNAQIRSVVKSVMTRDVEKKYFDQYSAGSIPVAGTLTNISDITRGVDVIQRVANQVTLKHLCVKATFNIHPSAANCYVRMLVVLDKMGTNAPIMGDILDSGFLSSPFVAVAPVYWDYRKRFKILYDQKAVMTTAAFTATTLTAELALNIQSQHIGASTTFKNQLYLIILSTEQNVLTLPGHYWHARLQFTDE